MNAAEYARYRNVNQARVSRWIKSGVLNKSVKKSRGRYTIDRKMADDELIKNLDPAFRSKALDFKPPKKPKGSGKGNGGKDPNAAADPSYLDARTSEKFYQAGRQKLAYEREMGNMIDRAAAERDIKEIAIQVKTTLNGMGTRIAAELAATGDINRCREIIDNEVRIILSDLSDGLARVI